VLCSIASTPASRSGWRISSRPEGFTRDTPEAAAVKVFLAFLFVSFVVGGLPATRRFTIKRPPVLLALCALVAVSFLSLKVVL
jgi:hypothetical protein